MRPLIAGNWKMHGLAPQLCEIDAIAASVRASPTFADILICLPATLIARAVQTAGGRIAIGGEDCSAEIAGAFTGDISAEMLKDAGAAAVIVGHSERRQHHGETDAIVAAKARAARRAGLLAIICIGETKSQRLDGKALSVCGDQIAGSVPDGMIPSAVTIGYEPLWAIGSGHMPTSEEIAEMHAHIRQCLAVRLGTEGKEVRILYGGSVKPSNARDILGLPEVGGALVGGASLKAADFEGIFRAVSAKA
jgi:triosephosphate isomerase